MLARILRVFAMAARSAADVELFTEAPRMHRPELGQLRLYQLDLLPDLFLIHADIITELSAFVNKKMSPLPK